METLTKKTTLLFSPRLHQRLTDLAAQRGKSLGELVRSACEHEYGSASAEDKVAAVRRMAGLALPVTNVERMKRDSVSKAGSSAR